MATAASPFVACMQLTDKRCCWPSFCRKSCRFGPLKLPFPPPPGHVVELYAVLVFASGLLSYSRSERFPALDYSCDQDDSVVWKSIFPLQRRLPCWGSLEVFQYMEKLRCNARNYTLRRLPGLYALFLLVYLWDDFWQTFQSLLNFRPTSASQMTKKPLTDRYKMEYRSCCCSLTFRRSTPS